LNAQVSKNISILVLLNDLNDPNYNDYLLANSYLQSNRSNDLKPF